MRDTPQRAGRNRTLTLSAAEMDRLREKLLFPEHPLSCGELAGRVLCGDMTRLLDFLPDAFVDLLILDPPYNLSKNFGGNSFQQMSDEAYTDYLASWFPRLMRLLKPDASVYLCGDWRCSAPQYEIMKRHLVIRNRIVWEREKGRGAKTNWKNCTEDIWFGTVGKNYYFDVDAVRIRRKVIAPYRHSDGSPKDWDDTADGKFRMTCPSNFWDDISVPYWSMPENTDHPTQKPEKLLAKLILASSPPGGFVFDPFLGSGTTAVAAKKLGRRFAGIEIDPEYACWALARLEKAETDKSIQGYADGVFWERNSTPRKSRNEPSPQPESQENVRLSHPIML